MQEVNAIYELMWLYYNLFQPVPPLSKQRVEGEKVRHTPDQAQTPSQRLLAAGSLSAQQQVRLQALYENTNPLALRQAISQHLATLWK